MQIWEPKAPNIGVGRILPCLEGLIASRKAFLTPRHTITLLKLPLSLYLFFLQVPASCCKLDTSGEKVDCASKNPVDLDEIYQNDCFVEAVVFVRGHATIIGGVAVAIASIMVCVFIKMRK